MARRRMAPRRGSGGETELNPYSRKTAILAAVVGAVAAGLVGIGAFLFKDVLWPKFTNESPVAVIHPTKVTARAFETIEFSSRGSHDPDDEPFDISWRVGSTEHDLITNGDCATFDQDGRAEVLSCRFVAPGSFIVSLVIQDSGGKTAMVDAHLEVTYAPEAQEYLALVARPRSAGLSQADSYRILLKAVNWPQVQSSVSVPIVLFDYDAGSPLLARHAERDIKPAERLVSALPGSPELGVNSYGLVERAQWVIWRDLSSVGLNTVKFASTGPLPRVPETDIAIDAYFETVGSLEEAAELLRESAPDGPVPHILAPNH